MPSNIRKAYIFSFFWMFLVIIPVIVPFFLSLGLTMQEVFWLQSIFGLTVAAFEIPTGYLCDVWGRKKTICVGAFLSGCAFSQLYWAHSFRALAVFEFVNAVGTSLVSGADVSFLYDSLKNPKAQRSEGTHAFANMQLAQVSAESIAALLGGWLVLYSFRHVLIAHAIVGWMPFLVSLSFEEPSYIRMAGRNHFKNLGRVIRHILVQDHLLRLIFINLVVWGLSTFIAVWIFQKYWQDHHIPLAYFGVLWAAYNITVGIVGKQVHDLERRLGSVPLLLFLALSPVLAYFGMGFSAGWWGIGFGLLFYCSRGVTQVLLRDAFNWRVPSEFRGTANSFQTFCFRLSFGALGPLVGYSLDRWGVSHTLVGLGALFLALFFLLMLPLAAEVGRVAPEVIPSGS